MEAGVNMKAIILAGGYGTRLKKVVFDRPKSMAPIAGIPFLEHQIRLLKEQNITEIILCVSYMADKIKSYFSDGKRIGVSITYSEEEVPLGTAGAIKKAEKFLRETFLVLNGDSYSQLSIADFLAFHQSKQSLCSVSLTEAKRALHYGGVILKEDKIIEFLEKQVDDLSLVNSGVYICEPAILEYIQKNQNISLEKNIFPQLAQEGKLHGYKYHGYFMDISHPETYEQFKQDVIDTLILREHHTMRDALRKIDMSGITLVLIADENKRLLGTLTDKDIHRTLVSRGAALDEPVGKIMNRNSPTAHVEMPEEQRMQLFATGINHIPIIDELGIIKDVEFRSEEIAAKSFPIVRGRAPLRISFAGGGTDVPYFFDKYGGAVVNATINKYCYATAVKRADRKIIIDSDLTDEREIEVGSIDNLQYNNKFDLVKAVVNTMKPDFGLEIYLYNDVPPGRGLGSSASLAVLIASILNYLMDAKYNDYKIAEIAYKAERDELKIKGGWQDQYATVTGGFSYMEFTNEKSLVYPLRLKEEVINELQSHLLLCYVGKSHASAEVHQAQEETFKTNEAEIVAHLHRLKQIAVEIRDILLTNHLEIFGKLLHESWESKRKLSQSISTQGIDALYEVGMKNGAHGGKLLGAGNGGYILFFYQPRRRNELKQALEKAGGEVIDFNFDFQGTLIWPARDKF